LLSIGSAMRIHHLLAAVASSLVLLVLGSGCLGGSEPTGEADGAITAEYCRLACEAARTEGCAPIERRCTASGGAESWTLIRGGYALRCQPAMYAACIISHGMPWCINGCTSDAAPAPEDDSSE
jgi:hypothetical protein